MLASFRNYDEIDGDTNESGDPLDFTTEEMDLIEDALELVANAYARTALPWAHQTLYCLPQAIRNHFRPISPASAFYRIHRGKIVFYKFDEEERIGNGVGGKTLGEDSLRNRIWIYKYGERRGTYFCNRSDECYMNFIIHETGHAFNNALNKVPSSVLGGQTNPLSIGLLTTDVTVKNGFYGTRENCWQRRLDGVGTGSEVFADQFLGWVYNQWEEEVGSGKWSDMGIRRHDFMEEYMPVWIKRLIGNPLQWSHW